MIRVIIISALWCPSCLIMMDKYDKIKSDYSNFEYVNYDFDFDKNKTAKYNPGKILPILIVKKNDVEILRIIGEKSYKEIKKQIEELINGK
ncbi:MAG: thioredoxin family protein [Erysipelotrichales bacterium]|nr:thioredoxin family protein [Erysipelotrichales bacterium]